MSRKKSEEFIPEEPLEELPVPDENPYLPDEYKEAIEALAEEPQPENLVEVEERREDLVVVEFYGDSQTKLMDLVGVAYDHLGEGGALYLTMPRKLRTLEWFRDFEGDLRKLFNVLSLNTGTNRYLRNQDVRQRFGLACVKQS